MKETKVDTALLKFLNQTCNMSLEDVLKNIEDMKNQDILKKHPYAITKGSNGRWYTYLPA